MVGVIDETLWQCHQIGTMEHLDNNTQIFHRIILKLVH